MKIKLVTLTFVIGINFLASNSLLAEEKSDPRKKIIDVLSKEGIFEPEVINQIKGEILEQAQDNEKIKGFLDVIKGIDPTRPEAVDVEKEGDNEKVEEEYTGKDKPIDLTAILVIGEKKIAVVNGAVVKEGDVIDGKEIQKIYENKVTVVEAGSIYDLTLPSASVKTDIKIDSKVKDSSKIKIEKKVDDKSKVNDTSKVEVKSEENNSLDTKDENNIKVEQKND